MKYSFYSVSLGHIINVKYEFEDGVDGMSFAACSDVFDEGNNRVLLNEISLMEIDRELTEELAEDQFFGGFNG